MNPNYWYNLISVAFEEGYAINGLSISYILGAYKSAYEKFDFNVVHIEWLLQHILDSSLEKTACIQHCNILKQPVIALKDSMILSYVEKSSVYFVNEMGVKNLSLLDEAKDWGSKPEQVASTILSLYNNVLREQNFSFCIETGKWVKFAPREEEINKNALLY